MGVLKPTEGLAADAELKKKLESQVKAPIQLSEVLPQGDVEQPPIMSVSHSYTGPSRQELADRKSLLDQYKISMAAQQANIDSAANALSKEKGRPLQDDLSAGLDFASYLVGRNIAPSYKSPETDSQRLDRQTRLREMLAKQQQALSDDQINLLKQKLSYSQSDRESGKDARAQQLADRDAFKTVQKEYSKLQDHMGEFDQAYSTVKSSIATGNVYDLQSALSSFSRMTGQKGVLSDYDIAMIRPDNLMFKFNQEISKVISDPTYKVPPQIVSAMLNVADRLKEKAAYNFNQRSKEIKENYEQGPGSYGSYANKLYKTVQKNRGEADANMFKPKSAQAVTAQKSVLTEDVMNEAQRLLDELEAKEKRSK